MPVVPFNNRPSAQPPRPPVDDPWLLMAAAAMHEQKRLVSKAKDPVNDGD